MIIGELDSAGAVRKPSPLASPMYPQPHWSSAMTRTAIIYTSMAAGLLALTLSPATVEAQSRVQYGRITNVVATTVNNQSAQAAGTLVGGLAGLATGSGQSGSNRALRTHRRRGRRSGRRNRCRSGAGFRVHGSDRRDDNGPHRFRSGGQAGRGLRRGGAGAVQQHPPSVRRSLRAAFGCTTPCGPRARCSASSGRSARRGHGGGQLPASRPSSKC